MKALLLLSPFLGAVALLALGRWLERVTRRPGLSSGLGGVVLLAAAGHGLAVGERLLSILFVLQAVFFLSHARWLRKTSPRS